MRKPTQFVPRAPSALASNCHAHSRRVKWAGCFRTPAALDTFTFLFIHVFGVRKVSGAIRFQQPERAIIPRLLHRLVVGGVLLQAVVHTYSYLSVSYMLL